MDQKTVGGMSRRTITWLWIIAVSAAIIALLYWERTALLYVLATLGVSGLLLVVAMSDLSGAHKNAAAFTDADDSAALGSGINNASSTQGKTWGARSARRS